MILDDYAEQMLSDLGASRVQRGSALCYPVRLPKIGTRTSSRRLGSELNRIAVEDH